MGFLITDTHGEFVETPVFPPESNRLISTTDLTLNTQGTVEGTLHIQTSGQYDLNTRWAYQQIQASALKDALAVELSEQFPGIQIEWYDISNLDELNEPMEIRLGFRVENYATLLENNMLLPLPIDEFKEYGEAFAGEQRRYSLDFGYPTQIEKTIRIHIPEGWRASVPADIHHTVESAELTRQYRQIDNIITYRLIFTLKSQTLPATAYAEAKPLFTSLASEDGSHLLLNTSGYSSMSRK